MASSKVVTTNPDLPRDSPLSSLSSLLSDLHSNSMDDLLKSIYTTHTPSSDDATAPSPPSSAPKTVDDVWKEIVAGSHSHSHSHSQGSADADADADAGAGEALEEMTLEDFLTKAGAVREEDVRGVVPLSTTATIVPPAPGINVNGGPHFAAVPVEASSAVEAFGNGIDGTVVGMAPPAASASSGGKGKRRAVEEPVDKATLQKQRRMIKNRESAARSRERKQAYTSELEYLVQQLEQENARLLSEEAEKEKQRYKQLKEFLIPITDEEKRKTKRRLRRTNSAQSI